MNDVTKVFVDVPQITGYVLASNEPLVIQFQFNAQINCFSVKDDVIRSYQENWQYNAAIGDSAGVIYAALYSGIISICTVQGLPIPAQDDIFCYVPVSLGQIFTEVPSIA
jgi:hypothetical protein